MQVRPFHTFHIPQRGFPRRSSYSGNSCARNFSWECSQEKCAHQVRSEGLYVPTIVTWMPKFGSKVAPIQDLSSSSYNSQIEKFLEIQKWQQSLLVYYVLMYCPLKALKLMKQCSTNQPLQYRVSLQTTLSSFTSSFTGQMA